MKRSEANKEILKLLSEYLEKNPDMRFNQALLGLNIVIEDSDLFYEESNDTLKFLKQRLSEIQNDN